MAEDLHADLGLWRALEQYQQAALGVSLPLVMQPADPPLEQFDERHAPFYHIVSLEMTVSRTDALNAVNVINNQPYRIRIEIEDAPFRGGQLIFGSLAPWRGEWCWSGQQQAYSESKPGMILFMIPQFPPEGNDHVP